MKYYWAALWRSRCRLDGKVEYIINRDLVPAIFRTRKQAAEFVEREYGFIKDRKDLRDEPHGWKYPKLIKVVVKEVGEK